MLELVKIIKISTKAAIFLAAFVLYGSLLFGQIAINADNVNSCENSTVHVPVYASDFNNINTFTLFIEIDTTLLTFEGHINPHPLLASGPLMSNSTDSGSVYNIIVTWNSMASISLEEGKLFDLVLQYNHGLATLTFSSNCEITQELTPVENVNYNHGGVFPLINTQPKNTHSTENGNAIFFVNFCDDCTYQWQLLQIHSWVDLSNNSLHYQGVDTHELSITNISLDLNNNSYRCVVTNPDCQVISDSASLMVSPLFINDLLQRQKALVIYPIPSDGKLYYHVNSTLQDVSISIVNILGKQVYYKHSNWLYAGNIETIYTGDFHAGLYFLQLIQNDAILSTAKIIVK
jgi:hypothetical protein